MKEIYVFSLIRLYWEEGVVIFENIKYFSEFFFKTRECNYFQKLFKNLF
jgi:hypothetical protein